MDRRRQVLTLAFASFGHALMHLFAAFYFVVVLTLEKEWQRPYHELVELWAFGSLLVGLGALPAGYLSDRWSRPAMMVVMFLGMGAGSIVCAFAPDTTVLFVGLSLIGLFASIYHPVGIPWVVGNAAKKGRALGINGVFGGGGIAVAGLVSGLLIDVGGVRSAFAVPGAVSVTAGAALLFCVARGWLGGAPVAAGERKPGASGGDGDLRAFMTLVVCMFAVGLAFHSMQTALPKSLVARGPVLALGDATGTGLMLTIIFGSGAAMQVVGGLLADRWSIKLLYVTGLLIQVPALIGVATATGMGLLSVATLASLVSSGILPAENMLIARFAPERHHGLAYGLKFVTAFSAAPLAVFLAAWMERAAGSVDGLFLVGAATMAVALVLGLTLPSQRRAAALA